MVTAATAVASGPTDRAAKWYAPEYLAPGASACRKLAKVGKL